MKKIGTKISAVFLAVFVICIAVVMSGCNDFRFNPIGEWKNTAHTIDGEPLQEVFGDAYFVFKKDGTMYMRLGNEDIFDTIYTYDYTDDNVTIYNGNGGKAEYKVSEDGTKLVMTNKTTDYVEIIEYTKQ